MGVFAVTRARAGARLASGLLLLLFSASASAEDDTMCADAWTTIDMRVCIHKAYKRADTELNVVWKKVVARVDDAGHMPVKERKSWKEDLLASQRAWITFKSHDCDAVGFEWWGGSFAPGAVSSCLLAHTTARTKNLKEHYLKSERYLDN